MSFDNRIFGEVKRDCSLVDYIKARTGGESVKSGATTFINPAPCCTHNDCFSIGKNDETWKCYSCGEPQGLKAGDVFHFAEKVLGMGRAEALRDIADFAGVRLPERPPPAGTPEPRREKSHAEYIAERCLADTKRAVDWLVEERGIDPEVAQKAALKKALGFNDWTSSKIAAGEKMHGGPAAAFIVRSLNPGHVMAVDLRYLDPELNGGVKTSTQGEKYGYGWTSDVKRLLSAETVYFCEGAVDALSVESAHMPGRTAAFAIRGTGNVSNVALDWMRGRLAVIVVDNDKPGADGYCAGLKAGWALHERLTRMDISAMLVDIAEWGDIEDVNHFLKTHGPEELRRALWKLEQWAIQGHWGKGRDNDLLESHEGKRRIYLPFHHDALYWRYRVRPDFTSYVDKVESSDDSENQAPKISLRELAGFRVAAISRVSIQGAISTTTGDPDTMPKTLFSVSVQTTRHGAKLIRKVVDDERLHNIDVWKRFGPVWDQSKFLRLVNIWENAAHIGARQAANFVGLCWREGRLAVNEGPDCYFQNPEQQCPYHAMTFPSGSRGDARRVIEAFSTTFGKSAAAILLTWSLGGHLKVILGFWPHLMLQARKGMGKSTLVKRLERAIAFTMFSGQSLQTEFRLLTSVSHTSHPVGWEELSARRQDVIDKAVSILQENYQFTLNRRGSEMLEFLLSAPVLLAGEDVPVNSLIGKIVRASLRVKGPLVPEDVPRFPVRQWLEFLADLSPAQVRGVFEECKQVCMKLSRAAGEDDGANRMATNYAALMTAWRLLCEFAGLDAKAGTFLNDLIAEMNSHIGETSADRQPWVWIMEKIAGELAHGHYEGPWKIDTYGRGADGEEECLFIRTSDVMHHLSRTTALREFWNGLPVKSDRVFKQQMEEAGVIIGEAEKTVGARRYSRMAVVSLARLEAFGVDVHRPDGG
ncbi:MAG: toprim domain-containing protein [Rhodocyclaceae bacterium]|nr:toprim domain-containing protein [Rhodocyclaceae bacterium]